MEHATHQFSYLVAKDISELSQSDSELLVRAIALTKIAYAPYSKFQVASVARLANGKIVEGTNQENASYPVGICAERALLGSIGTLFPNEIIETIAITYQPSNGKSDRPISPCGMCRQALYEYETRVNHSIRLILAGKEGNIFIVNTVKDLLPFSFGSEDLQ
ncbi:MAG TPA: cytidine deaminase [Niabella sp.]|nr:cytidine deaminase [Niabella sp.]HQX73272.1 cytidine deaminase [Chitinophagaceae bacterium]HQW16293.1 cytidine deaminase [Niabella sp.]HQX21505.1 cytidine deaminase [Niabella sp.]HRB37165.1 cytidine deaminase [Niabella sp.]